MALATALAAAGCGDGGDELGGWALSFGGTGTDAPNAVAASPGGGVIATGLFSDTATVGDVALTSANAWDAFVLAVDADGAPRWAQQLGGTGNDFGQAVAVDSDGSIVVIGSFAEKIELGSDTLTSRGGTDVFVARLGGDGAPQWLVAFGGDSEDSGRAVAFAENGDILIAGELTGAALFDGIPVETAGEIDGFVARLDPDGVAQAAWSIGGRGFDGALAIAAVPGGGFAVAGQFEGDMQIGAQSLSSKGFSDVWVAGYDSANAPQWARSFGATEDDFVRAAAVSVDGTLAIAGEATGDIDFGGGPQTTEATDAYVATYDAASGQPGWARLFAGSGHGTGRGVAFDVDGNLDFAGSFTESVGLDAFSATSAGASDVVAAQLDPAGNCLWLQRFGGTAADSATSLAVDPGAPTPIVAGFFEETGNFAYAALASAGGRDMFLLTLPR